MTKTMRMRITIQTERLLVMSQGRSLYSLCSACGDKVRMVTIDQAATLAQASSREIYREVEAGMLHFIETTEGSVLICFNSLNGSNMRQKALNG
jgi:ethanolamine utilization microcompartment shell protein EutL